MKRKLHAPALAALLAAALGSAHAASPAENDALAVSDAAIGLAQAVTAAEQHAGGKASRAEYERHNGKHVFDVEVVNGKRVMDVKVDPSSGKVIAATEDKADRDDAQDKDD